MVKHIVLFTLKEGVNKPQVIETARTVLEPLVGVIPGLLHLEVCPSYQGGTDFALYSEFTDRESLANYAPHPAHQEAKSHFWDFLDARYCADYEV